MLIGFCNYDYIIDKDEFVNVPDPVPYGIMSWLVSTHHLTMLTTSSVVSGIVTTAGSLK